MRNDNTIEEKEKIHNIGDVVTRAPRNDWISELEPMIIEMAPYPTSYDVNAGQPLRFTEFTYTEILGGVYLRTQSTEINARIMSEGGAFGAIEDNITPLIASLTDKYELESLGSSVDCDFPEDVCFLPGTNLVHMLDENVLAKHAFENDDLIFKPHPLTDDGYLNFLKGQYGGSNVVGPELSGMELLRNCTTAYTSSASELMITGALLEKDIVNIGAYTKEFMGVYYAITRVLLSKPKQERKLALATMLNTTDSGLIFPWMPDVEERIASFYKRALVLKERHRPLVPTYQQPIKRA